jgi:hypothetical protein
MYLSRASDWFMYITICRWQEANLFTTCIGQMTDWYYLSLTYVLTVADMLLTNVISVLTSDWLIYLSLASDLLVLPYLSGQGSNLCTTCSWQLTDWYYLSQASDWLVLPVGDGGLTYVLPVADRWLAGTTCHWQETYLCTICIWQLTDWCTLHNLSLTTDLCTICSWQMTDWCTTCRWQETYFNYFL